MGSVQFGKKALQCALLATATLLCSLSGCSSTADDTDQAVGGSGASVPLQTKAGAAAGGTTSVADDAGTEGIAGATGGGGATATGGTAGSAGAAPFTCGPTLTCEMGKTYCSRTYPGIPGGGQIIDCVSLPANCFDCACLCPPTFANGQCASSTAGIGVNACTCSGENAELTMTCAGQ
jgi:hypothetical protein